MEYLTIKYLKGETKMRHKKLRGEYETFLSSYKNRKELTLTKIRDIVYYVKDNNLDIKEVCEYLDLKEGDTLFISRGVIRLIKIQQKGGHFLTFEVTIIRKPKDYLYLPTMKEIFGAKPMPKGFIE